MKRLFLLVTVAALAYSGWWFYAAHALQSDVEAWFEDQRTAGWDASYSDISVRGFPSRTDLTLTDPALRAPDGRLAWQAPFFQILGLSYKPGHVIIAWADTQTLVAADKTYAITSDGLRASVVHTDGLILRSNLEAEVLNIAGPDHTLALAGVTLAMQKVDPSLAGYRLAVSIDSLAASNPTVTGSLVPEALASLRADTAIELHAPLTVQNVTQDTPKPFLFTFRQTEVSYGALKLKMFGESEFDDQGRASGEITIEAENWRASLEAAQANGDLPPALSDGLADILSLVASLSGGRDILDVTLGLDRGTVLLGPIPIGQLPALRWR